VNAQTLPGLFAAGRPADPQTVLLEVPGGQTLTYADVAAATARVGRALVSAGVTAGERVAVHVEKSPEALFVYLACVRIGAVLLPMNPAYTDDEVHYLVDDAEPTVIVHDPARRPPAGPRALTLDAAGAGSLTDLAAAQPTHLDDATPGPDDLAAMLYTSGTTGRPKGAMLTHRNLASNAVALHQKWGFLPDDVLLHALPVFHTHGLFVATNCVLANGTGMIFLPRFDPALVLDQLARTTVFMGVPTFYTRLLADPRLDQAACRNVRLFVSGSAPLLASTHAEFAARTGHRILERYGMTETSMITSNPLDGERRPGTVGFPLPDVVVRVTDPGTGRVLDAGEVGGVEVRGPNVFAGYWKRPELSASEMTPDGFFRTGDVGVFDGDGYLQLVGRSKDLIISGGLNVYPKEVEEVVDDLDGVLESAVIGLPDPDFGEAVVAVVVAEPGAAPDPEEWRRQTRLRLAAFKVPKRFVVVDALPRNAMGKVEKAKLRSAYGG
jgi:malonyl-CoA/methylmalonyl-CoA synthetase